MENDYLSPNQRDFLASSRQLTGPAPTAPKPGDIVQIGGGTSTRRIQQEISRATRHLEPQWIALAAPGTALIANGGTYTPTTSRARLGGNGVAVTATIATSGIQDGQLLILVGTSDANTVTFSRGAALRLAGASRTLGEGDSLQLIYDSTIGAWVELSYSNNSN